MARELTYVIRVDDTDARTKVSDIEQRMTTAGGATAKATVATAAYDKQLATTATTTKTTSAAIEKYTQAGQLMVRQATAMAGASGTVTKSLYEEARALMASTVAMEQTKAANLGMEASTTAVATAQVGLIGQVTSGIAKMAPYALAAQVITQALVDWYESSARAAVATETAAAKQDTIQRAFKVSGGVTMTYAKAVEYMNEQFARQPAFVDHAADALEHWNVAVKKGPLNAQNFAASDLAKNVADAASTVQAELGRIGFDTIEKALGLLRQETVLGNAAFNQWAKDLGLSSVTVGVLKEQVQAEEQAQKKLQQATADGTRTRERERQEVLRAAEAYERLMDAQIKQVRAGMVDVTQRRQRAGGIELIEILPSLSVPPALTQIPRLLEGANRQLSDLNGTSVTFEDGLQSVSEALGLVAQVGGESFSGIARQVGGVISQINLANQTLRQFTGTALTAGQQGATAIATIGFNILFALGAHAQRQEDIHTAIVNMWMNSSQVLAQYSDDVQRYVGRDVIQAFQDAIRQAQTLEEAQRHVAEMTSALNRGQSFMSGVQATVGLSQSQRDDEVKRAREILDYVNAAQQRYKDGRSAVPEFTEDQVNKAYIAWQQAMADAGNEAAQAWIRAQNAAVGGTAAVTNAMQSEIDSLKQSIANEAPEAVKGVIETQVEGQIAALQAQMRAQQTDMAATAANGASAAVVAIEDEFSDVVIHVPIVFDFPRMPGLPGPELPELPEVVPMADGGVGRASGPMLFYTAGNEDFAFSGEGKRFSGFGGSRESAGGAATTVNIVLNNPSFDTPAGRDRTLDRVSRAVMAQQQREGRRA